MAVNEEYNVLLRARDEASAGIRSMTGNVLKLVAAYAGIRTVVGILRDSVSAAIESERAWSLLGATVDQHGGSWKQVGDLVQLTAQEIQRTTGISDEALADSVRKLYNYGATMSQSLMLVRVAADVAASGQMDLSSATDLLGKASVGYTAVLARYGIILEEGLTKQQKFAAATEQMKKRFEETGDALGKTTLGQVRGLKEEIGDLEEQIGTFITKSGAAEKGIGGLRDVFESLNEQLIARGTPGLAAYTAQLRILEQDIKQLEEQNAGGVGWFARLMGVTPEGQAALLSGMQAQQVGLSFHVEILKLLAEQASNAANNIRDGSAAAKEAAENQRLFNETIYMGQKAIGEFFDEHNTKMDRWSEMLSASRKLLFDAQRDLFGPKPDEIVEGIASGTLRPTQALFPLEEWRREGEDLENLAQARMESVASIIQGGAVRGANALVDAFFGARLQLGEIFKGMAKDFLSFFIAEITRGLAIRAAAPILGFLGLGVPGLGKASGVAFGPPSPTGLPAPYAQGPMVTVNIGQVIGEEEYVRTKVVPLIVRQTQLGGAPFVLRAQ